MKRIIDVAGFLGEVGKNSDKKGNINSYDIGGILHKHTTSLEEDKGEHCEDAHKENQCDYHCGTKPNPEPEECKHKWRIVDGIYSQCWLCNNMGVTSLTKTKPKPKVPEKLTEKVEGYGIGQLFGKVNEIISYLKEKEDERI